MEKEYAPSAKEKKQTSAVKPVKHSVPASKDINTDKGMEAKKEEMVKTETTETQAEVKKEDKKPVVKLTKKDEAVVNALSVRASKKHCMYIGSFIRNKSMDQAIKELHEVIILKRAIPMKGEIPHRKGNMMSGRYPVDASKIFIALLKGLKGNAIVNQMDLDKTKIYFCSASWAARPNRKGGVRAKRTNVVLKAKEFDNKIKETKK